ncbi:hypothetical protein D9M72_625810 [compost metagenome]
MCQHVDPGIRGQAGTSCHVRLDCLDRGRDVLIVDAQVRGVTGRLPVAQAPAVLAEVQRIEVESVRTDIPGKFGLQEVVRPAVKVEHYSRAR